MGTIVKNNANDMQRINKQIETIGVGSIHSTKDDWSGGGGIINPLGVGGVGGAYDDSWRKGSMTRTHKSNTEATDHTTKTLSKTRYFFEPRAEVRIADSMLQPTPMFTKEWERLGKDLDELELANTSVWGDKHDYIQRFFTSFGTHVCPSVQLGGWWRVTANYRSTKDRGELEISDELSRAIEEKSSGSWSVVAAAGFTEALTGGALKGGRGWSARHENQKGNGTKNMSRHTKATSHIEVTQKWRGGMSGGNPTEWRKSLGEKENSNWRVLERYTEKCFGVWNWISNLTIKTSVSRDWFASYVDNLDDETKIPDVLLEADYATQRSALYNSARHSYCAKQRKQCQEPDQQYDDNTCECKSKRSSTNSTTSSTTSSTANAESRSI